MKKLFLLATLFVATLSSGQVLSNSGSTAGQINIGTSMFSNDQGGSIRLVPSAATATPFLDFAKFGSTSFARLMNTRYGLSLQYSKFNANNIELVHSEYGLGFGSNIIASDDGAGLTSMKFQVRKNSATFTDAMRIQTDGRVGIGAITTFPTNAIYNNYKLFVTGGILTDEVRVTLSASGTWADYVFAKDYKLKPLSEVETFININGHLPNVPSAKQVKEEGINVAEMATIQQEKIEELTLYIIAQNKRLEALEAKMNNK